MRLLFTAAIFIGSALLFLVQPMAAKMLLPSYGGTPGVWNTSMLFFQAALLLGYGYAHLSFRFLGPRVQPIAHLILLGAAFLALPIAFSGQPSPTNPSLTLLAQLALGVGLPFVMVSAGAPLLQRWYAATGAKDSEDPYFLYAASNVASIVALLAYPLLVEPLFRLSEQSRIWMFGYGGLALAVAGCAATVLSKAKGDPAAKPQASKTASPATRQILLWVALAFVPSSLLLGVTTYLTTNLASAPLLWVVPLVLYLLTFVIAFSKKNLFPSMFYGRLAAMLMAPMVLVIVLEATDPILILGMLHLLVFFLGALALHSRLYETRPDASHLTAFYFWISVGGVLGGVFNALVAPAVFNSIAEYPIALVLMIALLPTLKPAPFEYKDLLIPVGVGAFTAIAVVVCDAAGIPPGPPRTGLTLGIPALASFLFAERPIRYGMALGAVFLAANLFAIGSSGERLLTERSFFGMHRVMLTEKGKFRELMHGNTIHGRQNTAPDNRLEPLTYYHRTGPIGQVFETLTAELKDVGLVGLGVGSLAAYGQPGQGFTFFEIDPAVIQIAQDEKLFTFLSGSSATLDFVLGDARLRLAEPNRGPFDLLVLDAFSSDAIPTHLLTIEALNLYKDKLKPGGMIAIHISNRYLELKGILAAGAQELGMTAVLQEDLGVSDEERANGKFPSSWVLLAPDDESLGRFREAARWELLAAPEGQKPWTDDFSNLVEAFLAKRRSQG